MNSCLSERSCRFHNAVSRRPDGTYYYNHGGYLGHILPGVFFIIWGVWWMIATFNTYLRCASARKGFVSRPWYLAFFGPTWLRTIPLEPLIKVILPSIGILGELWLGHSSWMTLLGADGKFVVDNINVWQHAAMYLAFVVSGAVDMLGHFAGLPSGAERGFLGLAFLIEGLLLAFHLKGPEIEVTMHLIVALLVFATVASIAVEAAAPRSLMVATVRPAVTVLQGVWWIQMAYMMFLSNPAFDPDEMGGVMMTPVILVTHMLWVAVGTLFLLLIMRFMYSKFLGREVAFAPLKSTEGNGRLNDLEDGEGILELTDLRLHK